MTPHRRRRKGKHIGTLVLAWQRRTVGRIYRATGLEDTPAGRKRLRQITAACETLFQTGRIDVLDAVRLGIVHPMRLLEAQRLEKLSLLPTPEHVADLEAPMRAWVEATKNVHTQTMRRAVMDRLLELDAAPTLGKLPALVAALRTAMAETPAQANRVREQAMAFIRDTLGKTHKLHADLSAMGGLETRPVRRRIHLTADEWRTSLAKVGPAQDYWWGLCLTGMNPKEFEGAWEPAGAGIVIHGTKAKDRERIVPRIAPVTPPTVSRDVLVWWLNKAGLYPYCARHSYSRWLEDAGIPPWRVRAYMGHSAASQTERYQRGNMTAYLVGDGALLRAFLGFPAEAARLAVEA
jgi:integrase